MAVSHPTPQEARPGRAMSAGRYLRRNPSLVVGILLLGILVLFVGIGQLTVDTSKARALSAPAMRLFRSAQRSVSALPMRYMSIRPVFLQSRRRARQFR